MKIGLCLAGGGIKGAAHIGVLKALEEENIDFQYIAGTSSGSIVATLYAIGYSADEIYALFQKYAKKIRYVDFKNIIKLIGGLIIQRKIIIDGLTSGEIIEKIIEKACINKGITKIEQVPKKLLIPSVDLNTGKVNIIDVVSNSLEIMEHELSNYELEGADILLKIDTKQVSLLETSQMQYLYQRGYKTAKDYLLKSLKT